MYGTVESNHVYGFIRTALKPSRTCRLEPPAKHDTASRSPGARRYVAYGVPFRNTTTFNWKRTPRRTRTLTVPGKGRVCCVTLAALLCLLQRK
jgi:hypothetical protein